MVLALCKGLASRHVIRVLIPAKWLVALTVSVVCVWTDTASAQYINRFTTISNGAVTFTGNTLGLDGATNQNGQGTRGAIGTFTTTDTSLRDTFPSPSFGTPFFPFGTTSNWRLNGSQALLRLPAGARVLHAELIWGGTFAGTDNDDNVGAFVNSAVSFTTPAGTFEVAPDPFTDQIDGSVNFDGTCRVESNGCYYVRTANVTSLVAKGGGGAYRTSRVPANQGVTDNNFPSAGWTLAVVYEDFSQPVRNLSLFLGFEAAGGSAASVSGFCTPTSGPLSGRLAVTAMEGDAWMTGDGMLFGPSPFLNDFDRVQGPRNPLTNFFSSQIVGDNGELDTSGTFGSRNHTPGNAVVGARQGWDITNVDVSNRLRNNQTSAFVRGTTVQESYRITALALQINVGAPSFQSEGSASVDRTIAAVGDVLTYTVRLDNSQGTTNATNLIFYDTLAAGTSFVPNSFTVNGVPQPGANPVTGVPLNTLAAGTTTTVTFQARVDGIPPGPNPDQRVNRARWTFDFVSCAGQAVQPGSAEANPVVTVVPVADLSITKTLINPPVNAGGLVQYRVVVKNSGPSAVPGATITDNGGTPPLADLNWTCVPDPGASTCPASGSGALNALASLPVGGGATFTITGRLPSATPPGTLTNTATVTSPPAVPDSNLSNNIATSSAPIATSADLRVTTTGPASAQRGTNVTYTIRVLNIGPSVAQNVVVTNPTPPGLTLVTPLSGPCAASPGCAIAVGALEILTVTFAIPPGYTGADPITNTASATAATTDPLAANNSATSHTALDAPAVDLTLTKTNGEDVVTAGEQTTYVITITNAGPASAIGARVVDQFDPAVLTNVQWQCAPSGTSTCAATGPQTGNIDTLVDVAPGAANDVVITVQALVRADALGTLTNSATVTAAAGTGESTVSDNTATDTDPVTTEADISIVKGGPSTIVAGTTADYTITVTNGGPSTVRNLVFIEVPEEGDTLFAGMVRPDLIQAIATPPGARCELQPVRHTVTNEPMVAPLCTIPLLEPGTQVFTVRLAIPADFQTGGSPSAITNSATLLTAEVDTDPDQNDRIGFVTSTVSAQADVAVTKTGPAAVIAAGAVSYVINVSNDGPSTATNIVVNDPVPAGLVSIGGSGPCGGAFPCTIATLAPGLNVTMRIDLFVPVDYAGPSPFVNTATASADVLDPDTANNSASVSTLVASDHADLEVSLTGPASVAPGGRVEYVGRVTNLGPGPAVDVMSSVVIPAGAALIDSSVPPGSTCTGPTPGTNNLGSCLTSVLPAGASREFRFTLEVDPDVTPDSVLVNVGAASSPTPDFNPGNDRVALTTVVADLADADLSVEITEDSDPAVAGSNVTYTVIVRNDGPAAATNVTLADILPPELSLVSAVASQGSCTDTLCSLDTLAPSTTASVTVVATTSVTGVFTNRATVARTERDPVSANDTAEESTTVAMSDQADLLIEKIGPTVIAPGQSSFYAIRVTNRGPAPATTVSIVDTLPDELIFVGNSGGCVTAFPCDFDVLQPGESVIIVSAFTVAPGVLTPATVVNIGNVSSAGTSDPDGTNNSTSVTTDIESSSNADVVVVKHDSPDAVLAGTPLSYALTVVNRGPATATSVVVSDTLPSGVTLISATATQGSCTGTTVVTCSIGTLPPGSIAQIGILGTAPFAVPTPNPMNNSASATSDASDPDAVNNTATATTTVLAPMADLAVTKVLNTPAIPGLEASYTIVVTNNGPSTVVGASVVDTFAAALSTVSWTCVAEAGSSCAAASGVGAISTTVNLESGDTATFITTGTIAPSALGSLVNTVIVTVPTDTTDSVPTNNAAVSSVPLTPFADLQVSASGPVQATPGTNISYTITVTNAGPSDALDVTLAQPAPIGLTFVAGGGPCAAYPCTLGTVPAGTTIVTTATFMIPPAYSTPDPINSTATVSSAMTLDPAAGNNTATVASAIAAPVTDLGIAKTNGTLTVVPGAATTYTITVTNAGPSAASGATVTDIFPVGLTGVTWVCGSTSGGTCGAPSGNGNINTTVNVPVGGSVVFTITSTVAPDAVGILVNTATVAPGPGASDPSSANNTDADTLTPQVDLAITKIGPASVVPGNELVYTITVTNNGPSNAERVVVTDPTPVGLQFVSNTGDCSTTFPCDLGTLTPGATRTITATFDVPSAALVDQPITNIATVSSTTPDTTPSNNSAQAATELDQDADVEVSTVIAPATGVRVGDTIVVTVNALNRGPNPATDVAITDNLPAGFELVSAVPAQGSYDATTGAWTAGTIAVNATAQLDLTVIVTSPGSITNIAVKTAQNEPDPVTANDSAAATINAEPAADLAVDKTRNIGAPLVGETVTFTVRVTNRGPSPATGITIEDALPAGFTFVSAGPTLGAYDALTGIWTIGDLDILGEATLTLMAIVDIPGALSNTAVVAALDQVDPNPLNNRAAASINAVPNADLQVTKAVSNLSPAVGTEVTYTIAATNLGPSAATNAEILDLLPAGVTFVSATPSQGTYNPGTGIWTLGAIPVTGTETLSIVGRVTQLATIDNNAARQSSAPVDPNADNDGATVAAMPSIVTDLAVTKTPSVAAVAAGGPVTWTIVVTNRGPSPVAGVQVTDVFPAAVSNVQWTCTASVGAACAASSGLVTINTTVDLPASGTATFLATGIIGDAVTGPVDNVVALTVPMGADDPDLTNNTASGPVEVTAVSDLEATGTGPASVMPGTTIVYTFTVVNAGPSVTANAALVVPTPAGLTPAGVSGACAALPCALGRIVPGDRRAVSISYDVPLTYEAPDPIVVTAIAGSTSDLDFTNNTATVITAVSALADLAIVKTGPARAAPGRTVTYTLTITNAGPAPAIGVEIEDPTPSGMTFVSASEPCTAGFPCTLSSVASGESITVMVTFRLEVSFAPGATITNEARVRAITGDPSPANNVAAVVTAIKHFGCDVDGDGLDEIVTGAGQSGGPHVRVISLAGGTPTELVSFYAYDPAFIGGVHVACGDIDSDGLADIVTGAGPLGGPHVKVLSLASGAVTTLASFYAYDPAFIGGVYVAAGDVDGDGLVEIITGAGPGGGPHVRVISYDGGTLTELSSFYAYDPAFIGGVHVAAGDVDGDGIDEVITGAGLTGRPRVRVLRIDGSTQTELASFYAYNQSFIGGVRVAAGDIDGDGIAEVITGAGPFGGPHVRVLGVTGNTLDEKASFYAYDPAFAGGLWVGAGDVDGDGTMEIITGAGAGDGPQVRVIHVDGTSLVELASFYVYDPAFRGGVTVARAEPSQDPSRSGVITTGWRASSPASVTRLSSDPGRAFDGSRVATTAPLRAAAPNPPARAGPHGRAPPDPDEIT